VRDKVVGNVVRCWKNVVADEIGLYSSTRIPRFSLLFVVFSCPVVEFVMCMCMLDCFM